MQKKNDSDPFDGEFRRMRTLARLANVIALIEGDCARKHDELLKADDDRKDLRDENSRLVVRLEAAERRIQELESQPARRQCASSNKGKGIL